MKKYPIYEWDEEEGVATCILSDGKNLFYGTAQCNSEDRDMMSEKVGLEIATLRADIKALTFYRDFEIKPALKAYNQLYYSMNKSLKFNSKSYENKMLQRKIRASKDDLDCINSIIDTSKKHLKNYIQEKDIAYKKIRKIRKEQKQEQK